MWFEHEKNKKYHREEARIQKNKDLKKQTNKEAHTLTYKHTANANNEN